MTAACNGSPGLSCVHFALQRTERALSSPCKSKPLFFLSVLAALGAQPKAGICKWEAQMDFSGQPSSEELAEFRSCPPTCFTPRSGMREACGCVLPLPLGDNSAFSLETSPAERGQNADHISGNLWIILPTHNRNALKGCSNWMGKIRVQTDYASPFSPRERKEPKCQSNTLY